MATGFTTPLVHAPVSSAEAYKYRNGLGLTGSAEFCVFHDDFLQKVTTNVPAGWSAAIVDTGGAITTTTTAATGANGVINITSDDASEGGVIYLEKTIQLTAGKGFFMEVRVQTDDITDGGFWFGLSDLTGTTNPEDLWTTVAANLVAFGMADGSAKTSMLSDKSNGGTTNETGTISIVADTWTTMAIGYDGLYLRGYVNGKLSQLWSQAATTIPTGVALAPFVGALNGNGAGGNNTKYDYVRIVSER